MINISTYPFRRMSFLFCWITFLSVFQTVSTQARAVANFNIRGIPVSVAGMIDRISFSTGIQKKLVFSWSAILSFASIINCFEHDTKFVYQFYLINYFYKNQAI